MIFSTFLVVLSLFHTLKAIPTIKFGVFFDKNDVDTQNALKFAISSHNAGIPKFRLEPIKRNITSVDAFQAEQAVCEMVESGAVAILGPKSIPIADVVGSICNALNIPHLVSYHRKIEFNKNPYHKFTRNVAPEPTLLSKALTKVIQNYAWKRFAVIYDSDESLIRLNDILQMFPAGLKSVMLYKYPGKDMVKNLLKGIGKHSETRVIVDCSIANIAEIVKQGLEVNMMNEYMSYFITMPDGHMLDISELKEVRSNITAIRMMSSDNIEVKNIVNNMVNERDYSYTKQYQQSTQFSSPLRLRIETALIRDMVRVLRSGLEMGLLYERIYEPTTKCEFIYENSGDPQIWKEGSELINNIDNGIVQGITGPISFDNNYSMRDDFLVDIIELERSAHAFQKVAQYDAKNLTVTRSFEELLLQKTATIQSKVFNVVTKTGKPFLDIVENATYLTGNDKFEGFAKDLMDAIAREKNFTYKMYVVEDNHPGKHNPDTGKWDGMIGEIIEGRADLAICDFTITYERKTVIDFSIPFMNLGISILYAKKTEDPPGVFSFLKPFDTAVWLHVSTALLCVVLALYLLAKITEADWENPHPCDEEPEELENIWNIHNSVWLTVGSIMAQGCDILPKGIPTRLTASVWWFFALILTASYTANLAAFLTKGAMEDTFENVEGLSKESQVKYGLVGGGSTEAFFKLSNESIYQKMWATMEHTEPSVFVDSNEEGIKKVKQSNYAFLMESAMIDYTTETECNLTNVGHWLDSKSYGIGMPMNSPFRDYINEAILKLMEDRTVLHLRELWWKTKNTLYIDGELVNCTKTAETNVNTTELKFQNVFGVFLVLFIGIGLAILIGISEFLWNVRQISVSQRITPYEAFRHELLFACKIWITRKPVLEARESPSLSSTTSSERT